jgi:hypothetical protein
MLRPVGPFKPRTCICVFDFSELACTDETLDDACVDKTVLEFPVPVVQPETATSMADANIIEIILRFNRNFILYTSLISMLKPAKCMKQQHFAFVPYNAAGHNNLQKISQ